MDGKRFDRLAKGLVTNGSRRLLVQTLAAGSVAAGLTRFGRGDMPAAAAGCVGPGSTCGPGARCCAGADCKQGKCRCKPNHAKCGRRCCLPGAGCAQFHDHDVALICLGPKLLNEPCDPLLPGACQSGVCDCGRGDCTCGCPPDRQRCGRLCCAADDLCVDGRCLTGQGTCPTGADACAPGEATRCNGNPECHCYQSTEGATRCGIIPMLKWTTNCFVGGCTTSDDCGWYGAGAFCAVKGGCCLFPPNPLPPAGYCLKPCPD